MQPYNDEIDTLENQYSRIVSADLSSLRTALSSLAGGPAIFIGTGGTLAAAAFAARLHETTAGQPATVMTPLEFARVSPLIRAGAVLFSAGLKHPDAMAVLGRMASGRFDPSIVVTLRPQESAEAVVPHTVQVVALPPLIIKEGFLATSSLLSMVAAVGRAYCGDDSLPTSLPWPDVEQPSVREHLLVLRTPELTAISIDIEVRCHELGLTAVQTADYRNFAHGRHFGVARRASTTSVIGLVSAPLEKLAAATLRALPDDVASVVTWHSKHEGIAGVVELLVASMQMAGRTATDQSINASRPGASAFGRRLYHLGLSRLLPPTVSGPVDRKLASLGTPLDSPVRAVCERSYRAWRNAVSGQGVGGLILDYDGTVCFTRRRMELPPERVRSELSRLLDTGLVIGFASGRGKSLHADLRKWIPSGLWSQVVVGLYNGGLIIDLGSEVPDWSTPEPLMIDVVDRLRMLPSFEMLKVDARSMQVTVSPIPGSFIRANRLSELVSEVVAREPALQVKVVTSAHSIDVVPVTTTKRTVAQLVASRTRGDVAAIGDQGDIGGNDHELLASVAFSLSVDRCSPDLTRCWNLDIKGKAGPDLLADYLSAFEDQSGTLRFRWSGK